MRPFIHFRQFVASTALIATAFTMCATAQENTRRPVMIDGTIPTGSATVNPNSGVSGEFGTWTVTYTVGNHGIAEGGAIRVQLPDEWHSGPRNSASRLQATDPSDECYITAHTSNESVQLGVVVEDEVENRLVKHPKFSLDGRYERYVFVVRVTVESGALSPGNTVSVVYGDTSGGSVGYRASVVAAEPLPILVAVDPDGSNRFRLIQSRPTITALPGEAVEMQLHGPSQAATDSTVQYRVAFVDKESNAAPTGTKVHLELLTGEAEYPEVIGISRYASSAEFEVRATTPGVVRLRVRSDKGGFIATGNPMLVTAELPEQPVYWGELHSHTHYSWDGVGRDSFDYARNVSGLDFYAMTDHSQEPQRGHYRGLNAAYWDDYTALTNAHYEPGEFVTLHAYEASFGRPYGHHIVYFRSAPGPLRNPTKTILPELWDALEAGEALTIPHHTGKFPNGVDFGVHDSRFRRNFEMYSGHGLSESYDPDHNLSFENSLFTSDAKSLTTPTFLQDVWIRGLRLSAVAASDDHRAHPGMPHYGLTAVRADALTREGVFDALYDGRTYATTGAKIILNFERADAGSDVPEFSITLHGTDEIEWVELLRYQPGQEKFEVVKRWEPGTWDFANSFSDTEARPGGVYYCRAKQVTPVRGRWAMAWSSAIWIADE